MCNNRVTVYTDNGRAIDLKCGTMWGYAMLTQLCPDCEAKYNRLYPQGWEHYPGDRCKHGAYVGGCGADYMCGRCENGDD